MGESEVWSIARGAPLVEMNSYGSFGVPGGTALGVGVGAVVL